MRRALLCVLYLSCTTARVSDEPFRVMTYNIRLNLASDGPNAWLHRRTEVVRIMREGRADIIGVQEALPDQLRDLDEMLGGFARFGSGRDADRGGEHSAVFYRATRFELLDDDTFWLSESGSPGVKGWDAAYPRIVTRGRLRDRVTGKTVEIFNTHFDHVGTVARRESAKILARRLNTVSGAIIVTGDFNDTAGSEAYRTLIGAGLRDAMTASTSPHQGPRSTWNAFKAVEHDRRIDFIFVRGPVVVLRHAIIDERLDDGRFPSDHLPVLAEIGVR